MRTKQEFGTLLVEDFRLRNFIKKSSDQAVQSAGIDRILKLSGLAMKSKVILYVARPGF